MPQVDEANGYESEGISALKGSANKARNIAARKVARAAASKAVSSLGLPVLIGVAAVVLAVVAGIVMMVFVVLSSAGGGGKDVTQQGQGHWAFAQVGINLGPLDSTSTDTLKYLGKPVSANEMKPGDLVFFDTYKPDGHVGIYIGNGKFIGSQPSIGVAVEDMTKGYWKEKFNGHVKRI